MPTEDPKLDMMDVFAGPIKSEPPELDATGMELDTSLPLPAIETPSPLAQPPADEEACERVSEEAHAPVEEGRAVDRDAQDEEAGASQPHNPNSPTGHEVPELATGDPEAQEEANGHQQATGKPEARGEANAEQQASEATVSAATGEADDVDGGGEGETSSRPDPNIDYSDFLQQQYNDLMQRLRDYKAKHGDVNVPRDYPEDPKLGAWVSEQRDRGRKGALPKDRYDALSKEGFVWESSSDIIWREKYERLLVYKEKFGDCAVPGNYAADPALAVWVKYQRDAKRRGRLGERQVAMLEEIGFQWELALEKQWNDKFEKLKVYHQTYGDCNVPYNFSEDPALGMWVKYQRDAMRRGRINQKYREMLDSLGFQWEPTLDKQWLDRFEKLKAFKQEYSHTCVPSTYKDQALVTWIGHQREAYKNGKLSAMRTKKLNSLEFQWVAVSWGDMYSKLVHYYEANGDANVPPNWQPDPALAHWVHDQRMKHKKGKLSETHRSQLEQISFRFEIPKGSLKKRKNDHPAGVGSGAPTTSKILKMEPLDSDPAGPAGEASAAAGGTALPSPTTANDTPSKAAAEYGDYLQSQWWKQLTKLELYKAAHGHCEVPRDWPEDPSMNSWIHEQRERYRKGQLPADRLESLNKLDFQWRTQADIQWDDHFERLQAYSKKYGNAQVPQTFAEDQKLANWCTYQRERIRKGKMPPERLERLEGIGFEWEPVLERQWNEKYEKLRAFVEVNGHCQVPWMYPEDPQFPTWVKTQRERRRKSKLPPAYIQRLNNIGFVWNPMAQRGSPGSTPLASRPEGAEHRLSDSGAATHHGGDSDGGRPKQHSGLVDPSQIHSMAAALKRTADALSLYAGQVTDVNAKNRRLSEKLKAANTRSSAAEQERDEGAGKLASQAATVKGLERKLELMTSALDRAEQQISSMQKDKSAAEQERARLEAALAAATTNQNGSTEFGPASWENGPGAGSSSGSRHQLCRACGERPASCVVMPCMHLLYCRPCLDAAQQTAKVCPGCETACLSVMDVQLNL